MTIPYSNMAAQQTALALRERIGAVIPRVGIILGSGLGGLVEDLRDVVRVPYSDIPGFVDVRVQGHAGELIVGTLDGVPVLALAGRFHLYEGHSAQLAGFPVRVICALGTRTLFISNAAGGVNPAYVPGDLMIIEDHLNLMFTSPLVGQQHQGDIRFPDMSDPYDREYRHILRKVANRQSLRIQEGVYAALLGPAYETRAEVRMLRTLGADAVGMSTVPEVLTARALGMRVAGVSCITNMACGVQDTPLDHTEVLLTAARVAQDFQALVRGFVAAVG